MNYQRSRISSKNILNEKFFKLAFTLSSPYAEINPGQFVMLKNLADSETFLPRPFSIYNMERKRSGAVASIELLIKVAGRATANLRESKLGTPVSILGPLGNGFTAGQDKRRVIMVAGGIGLAPFLITANKLRNENRSIALLYGGKSLSDKDILQDFDRVGYDVRCSSEDGSFGTRGLVTALLEEEVKNISDKKAALIFACGPEPMLRNVALEALAADIDCQLSFESRMACGIGTCHGCAIRVKGEGGSIKYKRVCKEGPVFDARSFYFEE